VFGVLSETTGSGKFLELFWSRVNSPQGATNMDFELNKKFCDPNANPTNCSTNNVTPLRTDGDKLITYDLSKGRTVPVISIRTWDGTNSVWGPATVITAEPIRRPSVLSTRRRSRPTRPAARRRPASELRIRFSSAKPRSSSVLSSHPEASAARLVPLT
jgi:hypothetical protein